MRIIVGISLSNPKPRFWDPTPPYYLPEVDAVMVSYAAFHESRNRRKEAMEKGIRGYLGIPDYVRIYLDNGAFSFWRKQQPPPIDDYVEFVEKTQPDWYPIPADYIPGPSLKVKQQKRLFRRTMKMNRQYSGNGYTPVIHAGDWLRTYLQAIEREGVSTSAGLALGGLVPRLLTKKGASSRTEVVDAIKRVRERYDSVDLHVFGIGGLTTLHLASVLDIDSIDSAGWRNRAARGLVLIPGKGERSAVPLGSWRGKELDEKDLVLLESCRCPACQQYGVEGLKASRRSGNKEPGAGLWGFCNRATHNLWTLFREAEEIQEHLAVGDYEDWYISHVRSPLFRRLIEYGLNHHGYLPKPLLNP